MKYYSMPEKYIYKEFGHYKFDNQIEDNAQNRRIVRKVLGVRGFSVVKVADGLEGYNMVRNLKPPLVLLDISLPSMDGIQIAGKLKEDVELAHIPVIALTASAIRGDRERFLEAGCDDYLSKPVRANELFDMVEKHYPVKKIQQKEKRFIC